MPKLGKYRLLKQLAVGGMGEIWLARQQGMGGFDRLAVIKTILPHLARRKKFVAMFVDEARLASQLSHPNIVQLYDLGKTDDSYYIAMEYVHGENLRMIKRTASRKFAHTTGTLPPLFSARLVSQACEALYYAHTIKDTSGNPLNIVHRDINPQNLLVSYDGQLKVVDFGIAKARGRMTETKTGDLKGKIVYMSPEQIRGKNIDSRSDIFALGIVLWEMVTGLRLFKDESDFLIMQSICHNPIPRPSKLVPGISSELESIIMKALEKNPDDRYQTANEMHLALEKLIQSSSMVVSSSHIGGFLRELFPERADRFKILEEKENIPDSGLIAGISDLFEEPEPSSADNAKIIFSAPSKPSKKKTPSSHSSSPGPHARPLLIQSSDEEIEEEIDLSLLVDPYADEKNEDIPEKTVSLKYPDRGLNTLHIAESAENTRREEIGNLLPEKKLTEPEEKESGPSKSSVQDLLESLESEAAPLPSDRFSRKKPDLYSDPEQNIFNEAEDFGMEEDFLHDEEDEKSSSDPEQVKYTGEPDQYEAAGAREIYKKKKTKKISAIFSGLSSGITVFLLNLQHKLPGKRVIGTRFTSALRLLLSVIILAGTALVFHFTGKNLFPSNIDHLPSTIKQMALDRSSAPETTILRIISRPSGATVVIDGEVTGITPFTETVMRAEVMIVELRNPGYLLWRRQVTADDEFVLVEAKLSPSFKGNE